MPEIADLPATAAAVMSGATRSACAAAQNGGIALKSTTAEPKARFIVFMLRSGYPPADLLPLTLHRSARFRPTLGIIVSDLRGQ
jgi:hypothetical protein